MRNGSPQPISIKFVFFVIVIASVMIFYISYPDNQKKINKNKTYEEMLEYSNKSNKAVKKPQNNKKVVSDEVKTEKYSPISERKEKEKENVTVQNTQETYNELLDEIAQYPAKNKTTVTNIINRLLVFHGYPQNTIKVISTDIEQSMPKTQSSYNVANFDFKSGIIYLSERMLYSINTKVLTAILAHELDHFDKLAKICNYMGVENFKNLFKENGITYIDTNFWTKASYYANIKDFNSEYYEDALKRFLTQNNIEQLSTYSDFYKLSENIRNPLEISAYKASDYVYNYYGIEIFDGPMKILTKEFNDVDWAIYNSISKNPLLKNERIAVFDYFFLNAIVNLYTDYKQEVDKCIKKKNGDLTDFWIDFKNSEKNFFQYGQMDNEAYQKMLSLLNKTKSELTKGITPQDAATALKYKINTLVANLFYENSISNLRTSSLNYLKYIKQENIIDEEQELKCILILLCIENELYKNNKEKQISLYYLKLPEELYNLYNINKKRKYLFIYNQSAFKNELNGAETEQELLKELLEKNRLNVRILNK